MKGKTTYWLEIPVIVEWTLNPAERQTLTYPGCAATLEFEAVTHPTDKEISAIIDDEMEQIEAVCWEEATEPPDEGI